MTTTTHATLSRTDLLAILADRDPDVTLEMLDLLGTEELREILTATTRDPETMLCARCSQEPYKGESLNDDGYCVGCAPAATTHAITFTVEIVAGDYETAVRKVSDSLWLGEDSGAMVSLTTNCARCINISDDEVVRSYE